LTSGTRTAHEDSFLFGDDEHIFREVDEGMLLEGCFKNRSLTNTVRDGQIDGRTEICPAKASFRIKLDRDTAGRGEQLNCPI